MAHILLLPFAPLVLPAVAGLGLAVFFFCARAFRILAWQHPAGTATVMASLLGLGWILWARGPRPSRGDG